MGRLVLQPWVLLLEPCPKNSKTTVFPGQVAQSPGFSSTVAITSASSIQRCTLEASMKFALIATEVSKLSTWGGHPAGTKIKSSASKLISWIVSCLGLSSLAILEGIKVSWKYWIQVTQGTGDAAKINHLGSPNAIACDQNTLTSKSWFARCPGRLRISIKKWWNEAIIQPYTAPSKD